VSVYTAHDGGFAGHVVTDLRDVYDVEEVQGG
jgi:hypothetical protein